MADKLIGKVTHYFTAIGVGAIKLKGKIKVGDILRFKGATTDFQQKVISLQYNRQDIKEAKPGQEVGIKTEQRVREDDKVFLVIEEKKKVSVKKTKKEAKKKREVKKTKRAKKKVVSKKTKRAKSSKKTTKKKTTKRRR